jgi:concanavalin A-like lectin/glucanase superfamily protein
MRQRGVTEIFSQSIKNKKFKTMKKQFLIMAVVVAAIISSCTKEAIETPGSQMSIGSNVSSSSLQFVDPLTTDLEALYRFNGDLSEATGHSSSGVPTGPGLTFTADRKGHANAAIQFTGNYGFDIPVLKMQPHISISMWVKYSAPIADMAPFVSGEISGGPTMGQKVDKYYASISTPATTSVISGVLDNKWHHVVATYDGSYLKLYIDGSYIGYSKNPMSYSWANIKQRIGYWVGVNGNQYWAGCMDDLRYYTRTLSASDVNALFNL